MEQEGISLFWLTYITGHTEMSYLMDNWCTKTDVIKCSSFLSRVRILISQNTTSEYFNYLPSQPAMTEAKDQK